MTDATIQQRREKVSYYLVKGVPETEMATMLKCSRATVVRDVKQLKDTAQSWLDGLAKDGFIHEYKLALDKVRDHEFELQKLFLTTPDTGHKIQILKALDENAKLYLELLGETPTIHAYKRAIHRLKEDKNVRPS
jgi:hypothetical protein